MTTRHDVSSVPLQGGYVAKQCPVRAQNDALRPGEPLPPDPFQQRLMDHGNAFEAEVLAEMLASEPGASVIDGGGPRAEAETLRAMTRRAPLILGGRLADPAGRRVGKPDVLVLAPEGRYRPVDVKWHKTLTEADPEGKGSAAAISPLGRPSRETAAVAPAFTARKRSDDALQLAHYQRMLERLGLAAAEGRFAGIIGTERVVVWHDLDAPLWRTPSLSGGTKFRSSMERYDFEFDFRLDIIAVAQRKRSDPSVDLLVAPVRCSECPGCPWAGYCGSILRRPPGDVSLLPKVGWRDWKLHRERGVTNRADLAALDVATADMVASGIDLGRLLGTAADAPPGTELATLEYLGLRSRDLRTLRSHRIATVGDLGKIHGVTATYSGTGMSSLPTQIDLARAALGPEPAYRRRGTKTLRVPRADVEVDVDMENVDDGCYLWGALVTDRTASGRVHEGYRPFATWEPMTPEVETRNSLAFWRWLMEVRAIASASGRSFTAYCYSASAENAPLRRLGLAAGIEAEIESFAASDEWVDVMRVWDAQLITGGAIGLKAVAPVVGFDWPVDDPGGAQSMVVYETAVLGDSEGRDAREWLYAYNQGDVEATLAIRDWMDRTEVPAIEVIDDAWRLTHRHSS